MATQHPHIATTPEGTHVIVPLHFPPPHSHHTPSPGSACPVPHQPKTASTGGCVYAFPGSINPHAPFSSLLKSSLLDIGILKSTLLPSLTLQTSLAGIAYVTGRLTDRLETKDLIRPLGPLINAWWNAVFRHTTINIFASGYGSPPTVSFLTALKALSGAERLLLGGVTLWAGRLFYRLLSRAQRRKDSPMYETLKKTWGFSWNKVLWQIYLPEVMLQACIGLPFSVAFRLGCPYTAGIGNAVGIGMDEKWKGFGQAVSVGLWTAGLVLEWLADWQLDEFKKKNSEATGGEGWEKKKKICKEGVWGIVRHPNYLGDALVHLSFPLLMYASDMLVPIALLGPVANYLFLRYVGGDKKDEYSRTRRYSSADVSKKVEFDRYKRERNSFWPDTSQVYNKWTWVVVGCGVAGALGYQGLLLLQSHG
ncbi:hypothetical protein QBC43DRAFT_373138 [Cladorrhinum sp. PSN259]|nr:hypothetical protein QBC43DRAFT_373138 [Cladorrhinum sp. PSN259]